MVDARPFRPIASSTVTSTVVTAFLVVATLIGFAGESGRGASAPLGSGWSLRGTLIPPAEAHL